MDDLRFEESEFTVGWCAICQRDVLTYVEDPDGDDGARCVHCEQRVGRLRVAVGDDLPQHGYGVIEDGGCGRPDCGNGRCNRGGAH
jgi:hypothetical protein